MTIRERTEEIEAQILHPRAALSKDTLGRLKHEVDDDIRTAFQRDRDRIIHSKSFRRLKHKTQVFLAPQGDHYRTRLTHTLEVAQIARTIARALRLNEDLTEAIALSHDLGHTPFGHVGEEVLRQIVPGGFDHYKQSLRVVDILEHKGQGLNLTFEVRDGIIKHSKGMGEIFTHDKKEMPRTLEGQIVRVSDIIAYVNHDLDDALRAEVITQENVPKEFFHNLGMSHSERINTMVTDVIYSTISANYESITLGAGITNSIHLLRAFLYDRVYESDITQKEFKKAKKILRELYDYFLEDPEIVFKEISSSKDNLTRIVCDFVAGMTDRFALALYEKLFLPQPLFDRKNIRFIP
jgi:dGTPase